MTESIASFNNLETTAHAQQKIEHELTKLQAMKLYPKVTMWLLYNVWVMVLLGYENQAGSIVISIPQFRKDFGYEFGGAYVLAAKWQSLISGLPIAALAIASFAVSYPADRFGRKAVLIAMLILTIPSIVLEFVATDIGMFLAGKTINAFCLGCFNVLCITYVSEVAPMVLRGWAASACSLSMSIGPFICYLINNTTATYTTRMAYRGVFIPQWIFSISCLLLSPFLPESPYYFIRKGRDEDALKSLKKLYNPTQAQQQYAIMKVTHEQLKLITKDSSYAACFKKKDIKRTMLVIFTLWMSPMSGVFFVAAYATYYYELAGFSTHKAYQLSCGGQALSMSGVICSWFTIDRFGRRFQMIGGMSIVAAINFIIGGTGVDTSNHAAMTTAVAFMAMYNFFFNASIGSLPFILSSEISSVSLRAKTMSIGSIISYSFNCMWSFVLPYMFNPDRANMGSKINFIFAALCTISVVVFYYFQPETAGRSFEEIDELYDKNVDPRKWKQYITEKQEKSEEVYDDMKAEASHVEFADDDE